MNWDFISIVNLINASLFAVILTNVIIQATRKNYSVPIFIRIVIFGMLGGFFAFIDSSGLIPIKIGDYDISLILQLSCYGLLYFNFYLFMESLVNLKPNIYRLCMAFGFLLLQLVSLWSIAWFSAQDVDGTGNLWLLADIGYNNLALFTCLIFGVPLYWRMYQYTKEKKSLAFAISLSIIGMGYIIISLVDYTGFAGEVPEALSTIRLLGEVFPMTGIFIFVLSYLSDIDYIYRLPSDHYVLMITEKSGVPLFSLKLENKKGIKVEESIVSGLLSSLIMIFNNVLKSEKAIKDVSSEDATIQIQEGSQVFAIVLGEMPSLVLRKALRRFVREFEEKYSEKLKVGSGEVSGFDDAKSLVKSVFPFFKVAA